jgi:hypothetical protein
MAMKLRSIRPPRLAGTSSSQALEVSSGAEPGSVEATRDVFTRVEYRRLSAIRSRVRAQLIRGLHPDQLSNVEQIEQGGSWST